MAFKTIIGASATALLLANGAAYAADAVFYAPVVAVELATPNYFDGLYAGIMFGPISNRMDNFFTGGGDIRGQFGGVFGYNHFIAPGIVIGGEIQATANTDFVGIIEYDAFALARLGFLTSDSFMTYLIGGAGYFVNQPALAFGGGVEWMVHDEFSIRLEALGIGQLGNSPNGNDTPAVSAIRITGGAIWHIGPHDPAGSGLPAAGTLEVTDFDGSYAGLYAGGIFNPPYDFFVDYGNSLHLSRFTFGGMAGWNFRFAEAFVAGIEMQGGVSFDTSGDIGPDVIGLARIGFVPFDGLMVYGAGGVGYLEHKFAYALGGGVEYAMWGNATLRAEVLALGELSATPVQSGFTASKWTVGTLWHFN